MKRTAKILSLILILAILVVMAAGCGSSSSSEVKKPAAVTSGGEAAASDSFGSSSSSSETASSGASAPAETIEEAVILDKDGIKVTAKKLDRSGLFGPELKLLIENDSEKDVTIQARNASVNGYMVETMFSADVAAGKKANESLTFMNSDVKTAGITTIADMEFYLHVFDPATWDDVFDSDIIKIETSAAEGFSYSYDDSGDQVYNEKGIEIVVKGLSEGDSWLGPSVVVYISNTSDQGLTVQARNVSINGFMVDPIFSSDVAAGKHAIDTITFMSNELEENDIEKIENIELSFHVYNMKSWDTLVDTPVVTIDFD